jgi:hypothetical protein
VGDGRRRRRSRAWATPRPRSRRLWGGTRRVGEERGRPPAAPTAYARRSPSMASPLCASRAPPRDGSDITFPDRPERSDGRALWSTSDRTRVRLRCPGCRKPPLSPTGTCGRCRRPSSAAYRGAFMGRADGGPVAASTDGRPPAPDCLTDRTRLPPSGRLTGFVPQQCPAVPPPVPVAVLGMPLAVHPGGGSPTSPTRDVVLQEHLAQKLIASADAGLPEDGLQVVLHGCRARHAGRARSPWRAAPACRSG